MHRISIVRTRRRRLACLVAVFAASTLAACVSSTPREHAALAMVWPKDGDNTLAASQPGQRFPSLKGDILNGPSPTSLAAARAVTGAALDQALAKP